MNRMCVFIISCFFLTFGYVYAEGFSLKPYVQIENSMVTFGSLIDKKLDPEVAGIIIYQGKENEEIMLKADVILTKLEQAGVFNVSLSGKHSIVQIGQPHMQKEQKEMNEPENALDYLKKHLYSFVDKDKYRIELNILNINPQFDLEQPFEQVEWLLPPIKNGLSDLRKFENIRIKSKNKTSQVRLKISLYANVFIIKEIHGKDEIIRGTHFKQQEMDLMTVGGFENIVVTLGDYQYAKAVNPGDILRYVKACPCS